MNISKRKTYLAAGWFGPNQDKSITEVESLLKEIDAVDHYFPRHDGVKLAPNELHDSDLRKRVFEDNVKHIDNADFIVTVLDGRDGYYDTGTLWEVGYAMSKGISVIVYDPAQCVNEDLQSIRGGFYAVCPNIETLRYYIQRYCSSDYVMSSSVIPKKVLFIGPDTTEEQQEANQDIVASIIMECHGSNFRWVDSLSNITLYESIDEVFAGVDYMISVIDERHPVVSWMMGQAYNRGVPVITYTNFDYGVNIMLLCSLLYHCKGKEELSSIMQKMKRDGIYSLPKFDDSSMKAI